MIQVKYLGGPNCQRILGKQISLVPETTAIDMCKQCPAKGKCLTYSCTTALKGAVSIHTPISSKGCDDPVLSRLAEREETFPSVPASNLVPISELE